MAVSVGKKWEKGAVYIGRPSPLGNPFYMSSEINRDAVCDAYEVWFNEQILKQNKSVLDELNRLVQLAGSGDLILGCYCGPEKRCHGDTIKRYVDNILNSKL